MKVNGKKETDMEKESIFGQMEMSMTAILSKANPKDKVASLSKTFHIDLTLKNYLQEFFYGRMAADTGENG